MDNSDERQNRGRLGRAILAAATLACCLAYLGRPHLGFVFDDAVTILHNRLVQESAWSAARENPFRAIVNLTFWAQHRLHRPAFDPRPLAEVQADIRQVGERLRPEYLDPATGAAVPVTVDTARGLVFPQPPAWPFRLFNLALHLLNGWLLFYIVRRLGAADALAAACASAFLLHPLATEPVNYITARFTLMALTFSLAATLAHLRADGRGRGEALAAVFYGLALFCKESAAPLPVILFVLDLARGRLRPLPLAGLALLAVYAVARSRWLVVLGARPGDVLDWPLYFLAEQRVFWLYLIKTALPVRLNFDYDVVSRPGLDAAFTAVNLALLLLAGWQVVRTLERMRREGERKGSPESGFHKWPLVFLLAWLALAPTSSFIPLADLAREDRVYPLLALILPAAIIGLARLLAPAARRRRPALIAAAVALCLLGLGSWSRNADWATELTLQRDIVAKSPRKARAAYNYATALKWHGRFASALHWYERTLALDPSHENARINAAVMRKMPSPAR